MMTPRYNNVVQLMHDHSPIKATELYNQNPVAQIVGEKYFEEMLYPDFIEICKKCCPYHISFISLPTQLWSPVLTWINENCRGWWYYSYSDSVRNFHFEDLKSATHFKLRWG